MRMAVSTPPPMAIDTAGSDEKGQEIYGKQEDMSDRRRRAQRARTLSHPQHRSKRCCDRLKYDGHEHIRYALAEKFGGLDGELGPEHGDASFGSSSGLRNNHVGRI